MAKSKPWRNRTIEKTYKGKVDIDRAYNDHFNPPPNTEPIGWAELGRRYDVSRQFIMDLLTQVHEERIKSESFEPRYWHILSKNKQAVIEELERRVADKGGLEKFTVKELADYLNLLQKAQTDYEKSVDMSRTAGADEADRIAEMHAGAFKLLSGEKVESSNPT